MFSENSGTWASLIKQLRKDRSDVLEEMVLAIDPLLTERLRGKVLMIDEILGTYPRQLKGVNHDEN